MREIVKGATVGNLWFKIITIAALLLLVASFVLPPSGAIDPSVLTGTSILLGFAALWVAYEAIMRGIDAKFTHGDTSIELNSPDND